MLQKFLRAVSQGRRHADTSVFYAKGHTVLFRNKALLFRTDWPEEAPEVVLLAAFPVEGNEDALTAGQVAMTVAELLNKQLPSGR